MKNNLIIIILLLIGLSCKAEIKCSFTHYSSEDGLSQNTVMSMLQDHKGVLWLATWDGINKFDGYSFKTYKAGQNNQISLTNNRVDELKEDIYGYIWALTYDNRAHRFNPGTETFEQVPSSGEESQLNIQSIEVLKKGVVWLLTEEAGAIRTFIEPSTQVVTTELFPYKILKIYEDTFTNEWMLTNNGLVLLKCGESQPVTYFADSKDTHPRVNQAFYSVEEFEDEIFFGSDRGRIWRYQKKGGRFQLLEIPTRRGVIAIDRISPEEMLFTTSKDGFYVYNVITGKVETYDRETCPQLPDHSIKSTYVDQYNMVWFELGQPGGVCFFDPSTRKLRHQVLKTEPGSAARSEPAFHIHEDLVNGYLWVHPFGGGLSYFDRKHKRLVPFYNAPGASDWLFSNKIHSILSDRQGNLWICTHSKGLEKVTFVKSEFTLEVPYPHNYESLSNEVRALYQDDEQRLWVSVKDGIIRIYNANNEYIGNLTEEGTISKSGRDITGVAYGFLQDSKGNMWIATKGDGLIKAEKVGERFKLTRFKYDLDDIYSLSNNDVYCVYEDKKGRIWAATFGGGLNYVEENEDGSIAFINHRNNLKGYPIDRCYRVRHITSDRNGNLWVGTTTGALRFREDFTNPEELDFYHYFRKPAETNSLSNNDVHWVTATDQNEVYLATFGGGLNKLVTIEEDGKAIFKSYTVRDGAPSDVMLSIQEDGNGNLWIGTEKGLGKFTLSKESFENYDDSSFDFKVRFNEAAAARLKNGGLVFGTNNGVLSFLPDSVQKSKYVPDIIFSRLLISNVEVTPQGEYSVLKKGIDDIDQLVLSHKENIFTLQYAALDMKKPENIQYAYKLEGFDEEWRYMNTQRTATYTNLPKGNYVFKVQSTNSDGVWVGNERSLAIIIKPSFWETPLAYFLYVLGIILIILMAVYILFMISRLKYEVSIEQQISDIKLRFFTNISHELRTPLTLIAGPLEHVLKNTQLPHEAREQLQVVERNTDRMLRLVNQLLDFRKIQNRKMKMRVQEVNVVTFVRHLMGNFEAMAEEHHIDFIFESENPEIKLWVDVDKLEKIVFNLLSNAFKYTPNGKMITLFIHEDEKTVAIGVQDQGIGIAENKKNSIFVRFENLVDKNVFNQESTGIGLSLVKELVELHKASIEVESQLREGSCFRVTFLKGKKHYDENVEFILSDSIEGLTAEQLIEKIPEEENREESEEVLKGTMLLVEDNLELRFFLRSIFSSTFKIIEAVDGMDGWSKALKFVPDIIISDVMMPEKDGLELTRELRADMTTSHIPIVLLTAKTTIESKLEGLEKGADDYITKPFSSTYLKARVENLLAQRDKLQQHYRSNLMPVVEHIKEEVETAPSPQETMSAHDRKFMNKLVELMEKNMDNGDLVVDDLVKELAVSRSVFFKKLKVLTGLAPIEFIKDMRVNRAAELIETGEFNMTQISYMVGINDPRYFSKCFKQKFGMTPTEYKDKIYKKS